MSAGSAVFWNVGEFLLSFLPIQGSRVWLLEGKDWVPATVTESKGGEVTFRTDYDKVRWEIY